MGDFISPLFAGQGTSLTTVSSAGTLPGLVVAGFGRHCLVETPDGQRVICHPRGKKSQVVVGDRVQWLPSQDEGTVEKVEQRSNLFYRQDEMRTKSFAANLDQVLVLVAADPEFCEGQLARALIAAQAERIEVLIVLNKSDLQPAFDRAWGLRLDAGLHIADEATMVYLGKSNVWGGGYRA